MEALGGLTSALASNPLAALLAVVLLALGWLAREYVQRGKDHAAEKDAIHAARIRDMQEQNAAHLATALQVGPLAAKLVSCVEILERITSARLGGSA